MRSIRVHVIGGTDSVREEGKQKAEEKKGSRGMKDVGETLHEEGLFLFFWQALVNCSLHSLPVKQT